jgi:hypothetical protein
MFEKAANKLNRQISVEPNWNREPTSAASRNLPKPYAHELQVGAIFA